MSGAYGTHKSFAWLRITEDEIQSELVCQLFLDFTRASMSVLIVG